MKTIVKNFTNLKQAERYQNRLYSRFDSVRLITFPVFTDSGNYVWEVNNNNKKGKK
jgi:hypothetical protein